MGPEISAIISGAVAAVSSIIVQAMISAAKNKELELKKMEADAKRATFEQEQRDEIAAIHVWMRTVNKKLDEHNNYAQKFGDAQRDIAVINAKIDILKQVKGE